MDSPADKLLNAPLDLDPFARDLRRLDDALTRRVRADPENVERGLAQLVLTLVELLRQIMERQALRRVEAGGLDQQTIERLGATLMALESRMEELKEIFGLSDEDLNLDLGHLARSRASRPRRLRLLGRIGDMLTWSTACCPSHSGSTALTAPPRRTKPRRK